MDKTEQKYLLLDYLLNHDENIDTTISVNLVGENIPIRVYPNGKPEIIWGLNR